MIGWVLGVSAAAVVAWAAYLIAAARTRRAAAAELTRTRHELAQRINELFSLQELAYLLSESLQLDHIVGQVARFVSRFLYSDGTLVVLTSESGSKLRIAAAEGCLSALAGRDLTQSESGVIGAAIGRERMEVVESGADGEAAGTIAGIPVGRAVVAPLRAHGVTVGAVAVVNNSGGPFATEDHRLLSTVATHAAIVLANARFFDLIREGKEQWETTFDALTEGMAVVDEAGHVRRANEAMAKLLGRPVEDMAGLPLRATPLGDSPGIMELLEAARGGEQRPPLTHRSDRLDRVLRVTAAPMRGSAPQDWVVTLVEDVTEQQALETQLIQSEKMAAVGQLVSGVAHELNNPLTSISGLSEFLLEQPTTSDRDRDHLKVIHEQAERAGRIVRNLLTFARTSSSDATNVDLNDVTQRTVALVGYELRLRDIELKMDLADDLQPVAGDRYEIQQVVVNLLTNAVQAVGNNPPERQRVIRITTTAVPDAVTLRVADTGPGIPEDALPDIFTPFYTTKEAGHGTGLGLSVSFGIVERHGGRLTAARAPEGGALFMLALPTATQVGASTTAGEMDAADELTQRPRASGDTAAKRTILLVDDDPAFRRMIRVIFSKSEQVVEEAPNAAEAIRLLARRNFDLVIADPRAAVSAGEMLADVLLRRWPSLRDRTILVTADVRSETDEWLRGLGCRYLRKPFKVNELKAQAAEMLEPTSPPDGTRLADTR